MVRREGAGVWVGEGRLKNGARGRTRLLERERRGGRAEGPGSEMGPISPVSGPALAAMPARPQGPQAALRGGSGGEGSRSERQRSRVCVFIIIISD